VYENHFTFRRSIYELVAAALGIPIWRGGFKPADKIAAIERMQTVKRRVVMVGDGRNDAPCLAVARQRRSHRTGTRGRDLPRRAAAAGAAVTIARRARRLMRQNLLLAVVYNAVAVPIAIFSYMTPLIAATAMSGSSILVTLNALRAYRRAPPTARREWPSTDNPQPGLVAA
jgi:P-type Cu2+ transporter